MDPHVHSALLSGMLILHLSRAADLAVSAGIRSPYVCVPTSLCGGRPVIDMAAWAQSSLRGFLPWGHTSICSPLDRADPVYDGTHLCETGMYRTGPMRCVSPVQEGGAAGWQEGGVLKGRQGQQRRGGGVPNPPGHSAAPGTRRSTGLACHRSVAAVLSALWRWHYQNWKHPSSHVLYVRPLLQPPEGLSVRWLVHHAMHAALCLLGKGEAKPSQAKALLTNPPRPGVCAVQC
jgi:hypothetical protein